MRSDADRMQRDLCANLLVWTEGLGQPQLIQSVIFSTNVLSALQTGDVLERARSHVVPDHFLNGKAEVFTMLIPKPTIAGNIPAFYLSASMCLTAQSREPIPSRIRPLR